eukprot:Phypoly_transcript_05037.p1 GENE.Phypoly_transcript_05037~~Phypoly_transcript_05037.p1  ORF type:complete len:628 (+),score=87.80 Phypoly_transcript_05037:240-1886(+)
MAPPNLQKEYAAMDTYMKEAKNTAMHADPHYKNDVELVTTLNGIWTFVNKLKTEIEDIVTIQSDAPLRPLPLGDFSFGYFELKLIHGGSGQHIGMGLARKFYYKLMPGWMKGSIGFHADDGRIFLSMDFGLETTEPWHVGDVCGCGIDFRRNNIFFTRNGVLVGTYAFPYVTQGLYATVGSKMTDESFSINFGNTTFLFDLVKYQAHLQKVHPSPQNCPTIPYSNLVQLFAEPSSFMSDMYEDEEYDAFPHPDVTPTLTFFNTIIFMLNTFPAESRSLSDRIEVMRGQLEEDGEQVPPKTELPTLRKFFAANLEKKKLLTLCDGLLQVRMSTLVRKFDSYVGDLLKVCQVITDDYHTNHPLLLYAYRFLVKMGLAIDSEDPSRITHDTWLKILLVLSGMIDTHLQKAKTKKREAVKSTKRYDPTYYYYNILNPDESNDLSTIYNNKKENIYFNPDDYQTRNTEHLELSHEELVFLSYVIIEHKSLLLRLSSILGDPDISDDDPQILEAILEWHFVFRYDMLNNHVQVHELRLSVLGAIRVILDEFDIF